MAYALIAGLPPVYGLYAALTPQIVYTIMGTSRQLAVGPVAMDSLLVAAGLGALSINDLRIYSNGNIIITNGRDYSSYFRIFKMGFFVSFCQNQLLGVYSGAALIISLSQVNI